MKFIITILLKGPSKKPPKNSFLVQWLLYFGNPHVFIALLDCLDDFIFMK